MFLEQENSFYTENMYKKFWGKTTIITTANHRQKHTRTNTNLEIFQRQQYQNCSFTKNVKSVDGRFQVELSTHAMRVSSGGQDANKWNNQFLVSYANYSTICNTADSQIQSSLFHKL